MPFSTEACDAAGVGNGVADTFTFGYRILNENQLHVWIVSPEGAPVLLALGTDYTVAGVRKSSGSVTLRGGPLADGWRIYIIRHLDVIQEATFKDQASFWPSRHEDTYDICRMVDLELRRRLAGSLRIPEYEDPADANMELGPAVLRRLTLVGFDANGRLILYNLNDVLGEGAEGGDGGGITVITNRPVIEGARITTAVEQTFDAAGQVVEFETVDSNDNGVADLDADPTILTAKTDGPYSIDGRILWKPGSGGTYHRLDLENVTNSEVLDQDVRNDFVSNALARSSHVTGVVFLLAGESVRLRAYTDAVDAGGTIEAASFSMYFLGGGGVASSAVGNPTGPAGGDLSGDFPSPTVTGLRGDALPANTINAFIKRNDANDGWEEVPFGTDPNTVCEGDDVRLSDDRTPLSHHTSHEAGGDDAIKLDDLEVPDDNTDLDVSTSAHGLAPKSPGWKFEKLDGVGGYSPASCDDISLKTVTEGCNAVARYVVPAIYTVSIFGSAIFVTAGGRKYQDISGHFNAPGRTAPAAALWDFDTFVDLLVDFRTGPNSGDLTDVRQWIAIATDVSANLYTLDDPSTNYVAGFRFSNSTSYSQPGTDTHFMAYCSDGSGSTVVDTGIAPALDTTYELYMDRSTPGHCKFYIDRVLVADITTHIPVTQTAFHYLSIVCTGLTDKHFRMGRMQLRYH